MTKASFFSESFIAQIKDAANLTAIVSEVVALEKRGRNFQGLCPFHSEKTPSFMVNEEKQIFHCFGCGMGGNVFTFLMQYHQLSFPEAVSDLAQRLGIPLPKMESNQLSKVNQGLKGELRAIQNQAAEFYHQTLMKGKNGQKGRDYLSYRKMNRTIADHFFLGYAPEGWDQLVSFFKNKPTSLSLLEQAGLIIKKEKGGFYDRFRNRLLFPIFDDRKQVIGFGGRALGQEPPKYLNSPESPIFNKSQVLYGLPQAAPAIRSSKQVIVVEGYFDLLSLFLHGFHQTVATLGTALGSYKIRKLKGLAEDIVLLFDGDPPGIQAALRSVSLFQEEGVSPRVKVLPADTDPDSYLFQVGPERFSAELKQAEPMMTFFFSQQMKEVGSQVQDQARMIDRLLPYLKALPSEWEKAYYVGLISQRLKVPEPVLWRSLAGKKSAPKVVSLTEKKGTNESVSGLEWHIIEAVLQFPQAATLLLEEDRGNFFESPEAMALYRILRETYKQQGEIKPSLLLDQLEDPALKNRVSSLAIRPLGEQKDEKGFLSDLLKRIDLKELQQQEKSLYREIRLKEKAGSTGELKPLLVLKNELLQKRKEILISSKN